MADLDLDLKLHIDQFKTFKRLLDKTCCNRKFYLHDVRSFLDLVDFKFSKVLALISQKHLPGS